MLSWLSTAAPPPAAHIETKWWDVWWVIHTSSCRFSQLSVVLDHQGLSLKFQNLPKSAALGSTAHLRRHTTLCISSGPKQGHATACSTQFHPTTQINCFCEASTPSKHEDTACTQGRVCEGCKSTTTTMQPCIWLLAHCAFHTTPHDTRTPHLTQNSPRILVATGGGGASTSSTTSTSCLTTTATRHSTCC